MMSIEKTSVEEVESFTTADGSTIRELMHPSYHANKNQSLAEATVAVGSSTRLHRHLCSEELYHITQGSGEMTLGNKKFVVETGDSVCIKPGTGHRIRNTGKIELKFLCCCAPYYTDEDTEIIDG